MGILHETLGRIVLEEGNLPPHRRDRCLVRGGLASESAVSILVDSMIRRLGCLAVDDAESEREPVALRQLG